MQTKLADFINNTPAGAVADEILRRCVHCGMCTATCPTYQLTGDELDSPRGRIYQIKQVLEGVPATESIQKHLDRCLTCRACETTCPAKVEYGKLVEIGRLEVERQIGRKPLEAAKRWALRRLINTPSVFKPAYRLGQAVRPVLPVSWRQKIMPKQKAGCIPAKRHGRQVIMPAGCVQPSLSPNIDAATVRVLDKLGIRAVFPEGGGCCGAVNLHLNAEHDALDNMRRNIDAWLPLLEQGAEAVLINASGCGSTVKEYGYHLRNDPQYAAKAAAVSASAKDIVEVIRAEVENIKLRPFEFQTLAYHPPCSLQHGQKLKGSVESLFAELGINLMLPADAHLCCGSAGTYAFFQPELSAHLGQAKRQNLAALQPDMILTANIGCITQLAENGGIPVRHWIEYLDGLVSAGE